MALIVTEGTIQTAKEEEKLIVLTKSIWRLKHLHGAVLGDIKDSQEVTELCGIIS